MPPLTRVRGVRIVPVVGAASVRLERDERAVVVLDVEGEHYYIASRAHGIRFDAGRGAYRYEPGLKPSFEFNGRGAEECPKLVAALKRMGLATRDSLLVQSTATGSNWIGSHPDQLPAFVKLALLALTDSPGKFFNFAELAVSNGLGPPSTDFIVVGFDALPVAAARNFVFRNGLVLIVFNPSSPDVLSAARAFHGKVDNIIMKVEAVHELGFYFDSAPTWCDAFTARVELDGTCLEYRLPSGCCTCGDLVAMINGGALMLYDKTGPMLPSDQLRKVRCKATGRFAAVSFKAVALPDDGSSSTEAARWQLFFQHTGAWLGSGRALFHPAI